MDNPTEQLQELHEMRDCVEKYFHLQEQIKKPTREGMIKALSEAQSVAGNEIITIEHSQGDVIPIPWTSFSNEDLYRKLNQYQQGIVNHCIRKFGEERFNTYVKSLIRNE